MWQKLLLLAGLVNVCFSDCSLYLSSPTCDDPAGYKGCIDLNDKDEGVCYRCTTLSADQYKSYKVITKNADEIVFYTDERCQDNEITIKDQCVQLAEQNNYFLICDAEGCPNEDDACPFDDDACPQIANCVEGGESCNICSPNADICTDICPGECLNGTCFHGIPELENPCEKDGDCRTFEYIEYERGYRMKCDGVCVIDEKSRKEKMYPGDFCSSNDDCKDSVCDQQESLCVGVDAGQDCKDTECNPEFHCGDDDLCKTRQVAGGLCDGKNLECELNLVCIIDDCVKFGSIEPNKRCTDINGKEFDEVCEEGSICEKETGLCRELDINEENYLQECNGKGENFCGKDGICACNPSEGKNVCIRPPTECRSAIQDYWSCISSVPCHAKSDPSIEKSCAYENCRSQKAEELRCLFEAANDGDPAILSTCAATHLSNWLGLF